jgi:hypothetical protein
MDSAMFETSGEASTLLIPAQQRTRVLSTSFVCLAGAASGSTRMASARERARCASMTILMKFA